MPVQTGVKFGTITMVYKTLHDLALLYMSNIFQSVSLVSGQHDLAYLTSCMYLGETYELADDHSGTLEQYKTVDSNVKVERIPQKY